MSFYSKITLFSLTVTLVIGLSFFVQAEDLVSGSYELKESNLTIDQDFYSQNISLTKKENDQELVAGEAKIVDQYFISEIPENEFLNEHSFLQSELGKVEFSIESDKPLFRKENFYHSQSILDKVKSIAGSESLPEYRLVKNINKGDNFVETKINIPGLDFETFYEKQGEKSVKQKISFKNNSNEEININLKLTHFINASHFSFEGETFLISRKPQFISPGEENKIFFENSDEKDFVYDFSDLLNFDPGIWIFEENSEKKMLVEIKVSIPARSSIVVDPVYEVDDTSLITDTAAPSQRKTWFSGKSYWVSFYSTDDDRIEFHYSTDGTSWSENTNARISISNWIADFSVDCDSRGESCFIAYSLGGRIYARQATDYPDDDFSWGSANVVLNPAFLHSYKYCDIRRDEDNYVWVIADLFDPGPAGIYSRKSSSTNDVSSWNGVETVETSVSSITTLPVIVPDYENSTMIAIWKDGTEVKYNIYDTSHSQWEHSRPIASSTSGFEYGISAVGFEDGSDGKVGLAYSRGSSLYFRVYPNVFGGWESEIELASSSNNIEYSTISHDSSNDKLYAIWIETGVLDTYYLKYIEGSSDYKDTADWGSEQTVTTTSSKVGTMEWLNSNYSNNLKIFAEYTVEEPKGSGTTVQFAKIISNSTPVLGEITLNGNDDIILTSGTTTEVIATATVTDADGYSDLEEILGSFYWSEVAGEERCDYDANACYGLGISSASCATSSCATNSCLISCSWDIWFHATPTHGSSETWDVWFGVTDSNSASDHGTESGEIKALASFDKSSSSIDYGNLNPGEDTGTLSESQVITNQGNCPIDLIIYGSDLEDSGNSIPVGYQEYATSAVAYGSGTDATSTETNVVDLDLTKPTDHPSNSTDTIYWGIGIPSIQAAGSYSGDTTYEAKAE